MSRRKIALIQGHPDGDRAHFCHALADRYAQAATAAGHRVKRIEVARLEFPLLRRMADWDGPVPATLRDAQEAIRWADHLVLVFPLWLGTMPALFKGFLEQILRPRFGFTPREGSGAKWKKGLSGKSARIVVTMGMPALLYRWYFQAHGVKGLERSILKFCGVKPVRETFLGMIERGERTRQRGLAKLEKLGREGR